ncbi:mucin-5AC-like isoform X2 [Xiphophorus couchianus]|uniref:mucin-5AC-like isoform X2 n=1 Tax=Xiphophorus couchianus TaxID=32473 RepID=UPI0010161A5B|nr:mucin-5AC-like isoform X2 [Xiphophorus couchianus]
MTEIWLITRRTSTMVLIITSVIFMSPLESSGFQLTTEKMKYDKARTYCRNMSTDVATVYSLAEVNIMINLVLPTASNIWIGLELGNLWIWHWTGSDQGTSFLNWDSGEPQDKKQEACAVMNQNGMWLEKDCGTPESFVCQGVGDVRTYIFVQTKKSWRDARGYCWNLSSDLVTIHSTEENKAVRNISTSEKLWIGLFKDPWTWSGGSNSSFRFWDTNEPRYGSNGNCVTADLGNNGTWSSQNCNNGNSVICGTEQIDIIHLSIHTFTATDPTTTSLQTTQNLTTYPASTNMETPSLISSQAGTTTFNSTLVSTEQQITNATTTEPSTISGLTAYTIYTMTTPPPQNATTPVPSITIGRTTSNTTEVISHPITTKSNNTSTKIPTMAPIQPPQNITTPAPSTVTRLTTSTHTEVVSHPITSELDNTSTEIPTMTLTPLQQNDTMPAPTTGTRSITSTTTEFVTYPTVTQLTSTNEEMATITSSEMPENATNPAPRTITGPTTFNTTKVGSHPITTELNNASTEMPTMTTTTTLQQNNITQGLSTITELITSNTTEVVSHPTITEFNNTSTELPTMSTTQQAQNVTTPTPTTGTGPNLSNTTEVVSHSIITELNNTSTEMPTMTLTPSLQNVSTSTLSTATGLTSDSTEVVSNPITSNLNSTNIEMPMITSTAPPQNLTTPAPLTDAGPTALNTTEVVSHPTIPQLNSTEVTPKQPPRNTTVNITTNSVFTPTLQTGTSIQTTTQSPTPMSTVSSFYSDGMILIQKNMTWISALSFCREHYVDLVQITNKDIQNKVAEKARSSTSPHVWLGLRYTCNFNFWFWTSSNAGCYQNWQPGEGPERATQCGESGAIEATGRQQWVGLPETQELNFICQTCGN